MKHDMTVSELLDLMAVTLAHHGLVIFGDDVKQCYTRMVRVVSKIDEYLATLSESQRAALSALRVKILKVVPSAEECITYGVPTFKVDGTSVAGFAAYKNHLSYLPMSGSVLSENSMGRRPIRRPSCFTAPS